MSSRKVTTTVKADKAEKVEVEKPVKADKAVKAEKVDKTTKADTAPATAPTKVEKPTKTEKTETETTEKVSKKKGPTKKEEEETVATEEPIIEEVTESNADESAEEIIDKHFHNLMELAVRNHKYSQTIYQEMKKLHRAYLNERKKNKKLLEKVNSTKKPRSGSNGLDKMVPVKTSEFRKFVESNYQLLNDKDGNQILTTLTYDENEGNLLISRKDALKLVNAYAKHHNLQQYEDKKRIKMDKTLQKLFPDFAERKADDGSLVEENFYFCSIMGGLTRHLNKDEDSE